jgi:hypothetical protein
MTLFLIFDDLANTVAEFQSNWSHTLIFPHLELGPWQVLNIDCATMLLALSSMPPGIPSPDDCRILDLVINRDSGSRVLAFAGRVGGESP